MKNKKYLLLLLIVPLLLGGMQLMKSEKSTITALYPRSPESFVGDPMPYYNGKDFLIYYLEDQRLDTIGFHPFSLLRTRNFYQYVDEGEVLPYVNEEDSIERALGTGSITQDKQGTYHAFYTGHNGSLMPKEQIMHAISRDGIKWEKIEHDTFKAGPNYAADDFRDPFVFWEEESQEYWMLITTRANDTGVIARYTSTDLSNWQDEGIFFSNDLGDDSNLECPSLVHYQGKWYLAFSDQFGERLVHYRVADEITGEFKRVDESDYVDGAGFYAGRLETDGENLYLVGWIPTKDNHEDRGNYNWAGNLAVHQLRSNEAGILSPTLPIAATKKITQETIALEQEQTLAFKEESMLYQSTYSPTNKRIVLSVGDQNHVVLDFNQQTMAYYYDHFDNLENSESKTAIQFEESDAYSVQIVKEKDILVVYTGGKALSNRIYAGAKEGIAIRIID